MSNEANMMNLINEYESTKRQQGQAISKYMARYIDDLNQEILEVELAIEASELEII